jgi:hypothetical protein
MDWIKKAPTALIVAIVVVVGVVSVSYIGGFVWLTVEGKDTAEYSRLINSAANMLMLLLGGTTAVASVSAARSASNAEDNTNGKSDAERQAIADAAAEATVRRLTGGR